MAPEQEYVSGRHFARLIGRSPSSVGLVAEAAGIRVQRIPGLAPRYNLADINALVASSVQVPARPQREAVSA